MGARMLPVQLIAWFDSKGIPSPVRFDMPPRGFGRSHQVRVDKITHNFEIDFAGNQLRYCRIIGKTQNRGRLHLQAYMVMYVVTARQWFVYAE